MKKEKAVNIRYLHIIKFAFQRGSPNWATIYLVLKATGPSTDDICNTKAANKNKYTGLFSTLIYEADLSEKMSKNIINIKFQSFES